MRGPLSRHDAYCVGCLFERLHHGCRRALAPAEAVDASIMPSAFDTQLLDAINPRLAPALMADYFQSVHEGEWENDPDHGSVMLCNPSVNVMPGVICREAISHYTNGNCALLAMMLHEENEGSEIVIVLRASAAAEGPWDEGQWCHLLARLADGRLLDINGVRDEAGLLAEWTSFHSVRESVRLQVVSLEMATETCGRAQDVHEIDREMARTYAIILLRKCSCA